MYVRVQNMPSPAFPPCVPTPNVFEIVIRKSLLIGNMEATRINDCCSGVDYSGGSHNTVLRIFLLSDHKTWSDIFFVLVLSHYAKPQR